MIASNQLDNNGFAVVCDFKAYCLILLFQSSNTDDLTKWHGAKNLPLLRGNGVTVGNYLNKKIGVIIEVLWNDTYMVNLENGLFLEVERMDILQVNSGICRFINIDTKYRKYMCFNKSMLEDLQEIDKKARISQIKANRKDMTKIQKVSIKQVFVFLATCSLIGFFVGIMGVLIFP